jgi:DNA modification methylase
VREGKSSHWGGDRTQTTVWEIANNNLFGNPQHEQTWGHGTQKPIECMSRPIINNSRPGQVIYDPFLGSGTALIAAEMTGRVCCGLELSPAAVILATRQAARPANLIVGDGTRNEFPAPSKEPPKPKTRLTGKAPYRFESIPLQR